MLITISFIIFRIVSVVLFSIENIVIISIKICKRKCIIVKRRLTTFYFFYDIFRFIIKFRLSDAYKTMVVVNLNIIKLIK